MQQGGSHQYGGVPSSEMATFSTTASAGGGSQLAEGVPNSNHLPTSQPTAEAVPPINSRPPNTANLEELATTVSAKFHDDESLVAGEETERGGTPGNRWPREETLALIKIRTDMDATFRDATLKGPLWDEVSRKLAEKGYARSAKKCKEKFENVHKYYKRTKEGRAGRQDGRCYRFFAQLEALHNISSGEGGCGGANHHQSSSAPSFGMSGSGSQPVPLTSVAPLNVKPQPTSVPLASGAAPTTVAAAAAEGGFSFSFDSSSSDTSETDGENTEAGEQVGRKRKRRSHRGADRKTMAFFNELMKQLMDQQEAMQRRFLETIEKREQDKMVREEAWKRQEMARLAREQEAVAQERAMSATRDTAIITLLQKITGQTIQLPQSTQHQRQQQNTDIALLRPVSETTAMHDRQPEFGGTGGSGATDPTSSRWPKDEVHALIQIRTGMESRYQEAGPKGQLWEEISAEMKRKGYNRSSKRCKEKWENINKYFKKMKESNKKRPEDAKTCPYFHQLEALYRQKSLAGAQPEPNQNFQLQKDVLPISTLPPPPTREQTTDDERNGNGSDTSNNNGGTTAQTSNGDLPISFFEEQTAGTLTAKKPEDMMELMAAGVDDYDRDSDNMDGAEEDEDEDEEEQKVAYKIEYQRPNVGSGASNGGGSQSSVAGRVASSATAGSSSFLAIVQ